MRRVCGGFRGLRRRTLVAAAALAFAGVAGGVAWATIPGGDGVIRGCYQKSSGILRVLDGHRDKCTRGEKPIEWNAAGQQGPQGEQGPPGEPGPGAVFTKLDLSGGENYIELSEGETTLVHTLQLPEEFTSSEFVVLSTVWITNRGDTPVDAGCTVLGSGGFDWPFTLQHGFNEMTFQGSLGGDDRTIELTCSVDSPPTGEVWFERAAMTAIPLIQTGE